MHFQMKIQPVDHRSYESYETLATPVKPKSRLKRLLQFPIVSKNNSETASAAGEVNEVEFEPSSLCLAKMVQNFMEDGPEKPKCGRNRCNCFNGNVKDVSDDEFDPSSDSFETLKSLTPCRSVVERNLLAEASNIVEKSKLYKRKDELTKLVAEGLLSIGYDVSICKSRWEKSSSYPAGEYEYIDVVIVDEARVLIDVDFRSEFEIARPTGSYRASVQSLPYIFVGDADRLQQILSVVAEAAKLSLKKKGMHVPPWRKFEYMRAKWLSAYVRTTLTSPLSAASVVSSLQTLPPTPPPTPNGDFAASKRVFSKTTPLESEAECGVFELILGEDTNTDMDTTPLESTEASEVTVAGVLPEGKSDEGFGSPAVGRWEPPALKPRSKLVVTGLGSLFREKA